MEISSFEKIVKDVCEHLTSIGVDENSIKKDCRLSKGFWADVVVVDKSSCRPIMAFELKQMSKNKVSSIPLQVGVFSEQLPYYLIVVESSGKSWITRLRSNGKVGSWIDFSESKLVKSYFLDDLDAAKAFTKKVLCRYDLLKQVKSIGRSVIRFWLPFVLLLMLIVHVFCRSLTWELVAYYGLIIVVVLVGYGVTIHIKYKDIEILLDKWKVEDEK